MDIKTNEISLALGRGKHTTSDWQTVEQHYKKADCIINPDLKDIPLHNLDKAEETIELGRQATLKIIDKIKNDLGIN